MEMLPEVIRLPAVTLPVVVVMLPGAVNVPVLSKYQKLVAEVLLL
jgi:hypothetical protein